MRLVARVIVALAAVGLLVVAVAGCNDWKWEWRKGGESASDAGTFVAAPRPKPTKPESAESGESAGATESTESVESTESTESGESSESTGSAESGESGTAASAESGESAEAPAESTPLESEATAESGESQASPESAEADAAPGPWYVPKPIRNALRMLKSAKPAEAATESAESEVAGETGPEPATPPSRGAKSETEEGAREREIPATLPLRGEASDEPSVKLQTMVLALLEQAKVDARVTRAHIEEAGRLVTDGESTRARTSTFEAIRSASFVRAGLPTVLARQCLDRAVIESEAGRTARAVDAIKAVKSIATKLPLKCTNDGFTRWASQAIDALEKGDPELARDIIGQMMGVIGSSEAEDDLDRLGNSLSSCLFAIDRDALTIAGAELDEANSLIFDVIQVTEGD